MIGRKARTLPAALALAALGCASSGSPDAPEPQAEERPAAAEDAHPLAAMRAHLSRQIDRQISERRTAPVGAPGPGMRAGESSDAALMREIDRARLGAKAEGALFGCVPSEESLAEVTGDMITYRRLTVDDFRADMAAELAPVADVGHSAKVSAHVVVDIACIARTDVQLTRTGRYEATIRELRYVGVLDRERSWLNPDSNVPLQWVLRHEQGHFDLAEIEARRRNQEVGQLIARLRSPGLSPEDALESLASKWEIHMRGVKTRLLGLELEYDRETRHGSDARKQSEWFARTQRQLRGLPVAEPPPPDRLGAARR